jgi:hypothetical protein
MLTYAFKITMQLLQNRKFRTVVLRTLVRLYLNLQVPDYISVCQVKNYLIYSFIEDVFCVSVSFFLMILIKSQIFYKHLFGVQLIKCLWDIKLVSIYMKVQHNNF